MFADDEMHVLGRRPARLPAVFIPHGSPMVLLDDDGYTRAPARTGKDLPRPRAIVVFSAHWEAPAPHADLAVPTSEHFDPLFVVLGATSDGEGVTVLHEGFQYGNLSMRSFLPGE